MRKLEFWRERSNIPHPTPTPKYKTRAQRTQWKENKWGQDLIIKEEAIWSHISYSISDHPSFNFDHARKGSHGGPPMPAGGPGLLRLRGEQQPPGSALALRFLETSQSYSSTLEPLLLLMRTCVSTQCRGRWCSWLPPGSPQPITPCRALVFAWPLLEAWAFLLSAPWAAGCSQAGPWSPFCLWLGCLPWPSEFWQCLPFLGPSGKVFLHLSLSSFFIQLVNKELVVRKKINIRFSILI